MAAHQSIALPMFAHHIQPVAFHGSAALIGRAGIRDADSVQDG